MDWLIPQQELMRNLLVEQEVHPKTIDSLIGSGYFMAETNGFRSVLSAKEYNYRECIYDSFYGSNSVLHVDYVKKKNYLRKRGLHPIFDRCIYVSTEQGLHDEINILLHKQKQMRSVFRSQLFFRGQAHEYILHREYPNYGLCNSSGGEVSLIASFWRKYAHSNYCERPREGNTELHRVFLHAEQDAFDTNALALAQHYGMATTMLDITYDLNVALFFAFHDLIQISDGKYTYKPILKERIGDAVIYVMSSRDVLVNREYSEYGIIDVEGLKSTRPFKQKCTVLEAGSEEINVAAAEIIGRIKFAKGFSYSQMPTMSDIIPNRNEDMFYDFLLSQKETDPALKDITEYVY